MRLLELKGEKAGGGAVRALEVGVFDQGHDGVFRADHVIVFGDVPEDGFVFFVFKLRGDEFAGNRFIVLEFGFQNGPFTVSKGGAAYAQGKQDRKDHG